MSISIGRRDFYIFIGLLGCGFSFLKLMWIALILFVILLKFGPPYNFDFYEGILIVWIILQLCGIRQTFTGGNPLANSLVMMELP